MFPSRVEDPMVRADILIQTFREINKASEQSLESRNRLLQNIEKSYKIINRLKSLQNAGWISMEAEQLQYLLMIIWHSTDTVSMPESPFSVGVSELSKEIEVTCYEDHIPDQATCSGFATRVTCLTLLKSPAMALAYDPSKRDSAFVEFEGGKMLGSAYRSGIMEARINDDSVCFPSTCPWVRVAQVDAGGMLTLLICRLDDLGRLYINGKSSSTNTQSLILEDKYFLQGESIVTGFIILWFYHRVIMV